MSTDGERTKGFVYVLQVRDISLPVCKIGRTSKSPGERCAEINKSSTGDFIWSVAHQVAVDDCIKLESLIHSTLAALRQKGREIFNINAEGAYLLLIAILNAHPEINDIPPEEITDAGNEITKTKKKKPVHEPRVRRRDPKYTELLQLFTGVFNVKGEPFGQLNKPTFGMSDGNDGVQWNLAIHPDTETARLGVNLEGLKYGNWPIASFVLAEMKNPCIEKVRAMLKRPREIHISFCRDAWQGPARPNIVEKYIGGKVLSFAEMDLDHWRSTLSEALGCLDKEKDYRARAKQKVTLENKPKQGDQSRVMEVSPHLTIWSPLSLNGNFKENMKNEIVELQPAYDWVERASR